LPHGPSDRAHPRLYLFGRASRANQCPVSGVKQPCRRNLETAEFGSNSDISSKRAHRAGLSFSRWIGGVSSTSIQNGSSRLLISQVFSPRSVPNRHLQGALRTKCFFGASVPKPIWLSRPMRGDLLAAGHVDDIALGAVGEIVLDAADTRVPSLGGPASMNLCRSSRMSDRVRSYGARTHKLSSRVFRQTGHRSRHR
jgi:hypothetical protein